MLTPEQSPGSASAAAGADPDAAAGRDAAPAAAAGARSRICNPRLPPLTEDSVANRSLDDLNRNSPLQPAFFGLDSADLDDAGRAVVSSNVDVLKKYPPVGGDHRGPL